MGASATRTANEGQYSAGAAASIAVRGAKVACAVGQISDAARCGAGGAAKGTNRGA